ncbi:sigma-70 family RNA polymerase sigma factor [Cytophagaceae bacterium YF14B1]|uniref:Sigma-70 family RNA polymerase sigma factor n=1 Tax=Xanthocytophaga flava TaxID=3048013 RepID=A0AAE3UAB6_9BACT|nr:sigma-70 family RNA polymerase sigma factor [Xanthocytophaga flavus]MDJ1485984.1 sigma-70 family RNA polymerase sigma factor [Xanthocytophaga flavus]
MKNLTTPTSQSSHSSTQSIPTQQASGKIQTSDLDLLYQIMDKEENPAVAKTAFNEFVNRFGKYLYSQCYQACQGLADAQELACDLTQDVFLKIWLDPSTFNEDGITDPVRLRKRIKAWLSRIARNRFNDYFDEFRIGGVEYLDEKQMEQLTEPEHVFFERIPSEKIEKALATLSARSLDILRTYMEYGDIDNPKAHLPDKQLKILTERYQTSSDNVRQIKHRAIKSLKEYFQKNP